MIDRISVLLWHGPCVPWGTILAVGGETDKWIDTAYAKYSFPNYTFLFYKTDCNICNSNT